MCIALLLPCCPVACGPSIDYPVKWFTVVVGEEAVVGRNAIAYQVKHLLQYPKEKVGESIHLHKGLSPTMLNRYHQPAQLKGDCLVEAHQMQSRQVV
jgi:hypothetical protein